MEADISLCRNENGAKHVQCSVGRAKSACSERFNIFSGMVQQVLAVSLVCVSEWHSFYLISLYIHVATQLRAPIVRLTPPALSGTTFISYLNIMSCHSAPPAWCVECHVLS